MKKPNIKVKSIKKAVVLGIVIILSGYFIITSFYEMINGKEFYSILGYLLKCCVSITVFLFNTIWFGNNLEY